MEKAVNFYTGYWEANDTDRYLPSILSSTPEGHLNLFADRIAQLYLEQQHKTLAATTVESWANSAGHLDNMLNDKADSIGVGLAQGINATGQPTWYCVQLFLYDGHEITWVDEMQIR